MASFAEVTDLEARWRPLTIAEQARATVLLEDASAMLRVEMPTIDARLAATPPTLDLQIPKIIVCKMVKRAMQAGDEGAGVGSLQQTAGPFSQSTTFSNPMGDLYLTKAERKMLGAGGTAAFSIDTRAGLCGTHLPWCSSMFGALYCSCGVDIAGYPIFEVGE